MAEQGRKKVNEAKPDLLKTYETSLEGLFRTIDLGYKYQEELKVEMNQATEAEQKNADKNGGNQ